MSNLSWLSGLISENEGAVKLLNGTNLAFSGTEIVVSAGPSLNILHEFDIGTYGSAHYVIHVECGTDQRETLNASVVAKYDAASITVYGRINTGVNLINLQADITDGVLKLYATSAVQGLQRIRVTAFATLAESIVDVDSKATVYYFSKVNATPKYTLNLGLYSVDETAPSLTFYKGLTYRIDQSDTSNNVDTLLVGTGTDGGVGNSTITYNVTVAGPQSPDTGNKYILNGIYKPVLKFTIGYTYVFNQDDSTNVYFPNASGTVLNPHPLNFSFDNLSGELAGGTSYLNQVEYRLDGSVVTQAVYNSSAFNTATARQVQIIVTDSTPTTLYYWCYNHLGMGNSISSAYLSGISYYLDNKKVTRQTYLQQLTFQTAETRYIEVSVNDDYPETLYYYSASRPQLGNAISVTSVVDVGSAGSGSAGSGGNTTPTTGADQELSNLGVTAINSSLIPAVDSSIDLGSAFNKWKDLYLSGNSLFLGSAVITATGNAINLPVGSTVGGQNIGSGSSTGTAFSTVRVLGQSDIVSADVGSIVNFAAGANISLITDPSTGTVTISSTSAGGTGTSGNAFTTIAVSGQSPVVADTSTETLTLIAGPNITLTTNPTGDAITISASATGGGGASGVSGGQANRLAYYATTGSVVQDSGPDLEWNGTFLQVVGTVYITGQKSYIRQYWDSLADLNIEAPPNVWRGMIAYSGDTGRVYYAHSGTWNRLARFDEIPATANAFGRVQAGGQTISSTTPNDILSVVGGVGIEIASDPTTKTLLITNTGGGTGGDSGFSAKDAQDASASLFLTGQHIGITFTYDDFNNRINANVSAIAGIYTDEQAQDAAGALFQSGVHNGITFTYDDANDRIDASIVNETAREYIQDQSAALFTAGNHSNISFTYDDLNNRINASVPVANIFSTIAVAGQNSVLADSVTDTLTLAAGFGIAISTNAITDTITITNTASQNTFSTIAVSGQNSVVADSAADTLTLIAGSNISITTNSTTDAITITATAVPGTTSDSFTTIAVAGQNNVIADSSTDILTLVAGTGISITTNAITDTITITSTASGGGVTAFTGLSDSAGLTVDKFFLPAITMLSTTNNGASSYRFDQYGTVDNPTVYAINGTTIAFNLNVIGHPFLIQTSGGSNYNEGLVHVTTTGVVTTGASAQGKTNGTLYWKVPVSISGNYRYICSIHSGMVGAISIKNFSAI